MTEKFFANPSILDLHREQARQGALLENLCSDTQEIKDCLMGHDDRVGLVIEVDRLKQTQKKASKIDWFLFTSVCGGLILIVLKSIWSA